jgi:hypothetical protein
MSDSREQKLCIKIFSCMGKQLLEHMPYYKEPLEKRGVI